ncbi:BatD family protein [Elusimicrobiota bacterium]
MDDDSVSINEQLTLQVSINGDVSNIPNPQIPPLNDFGIYSSGRSQNISIINGKVSSSINFNYTLTPKNIGQFVIPPFTINHKNKTYSTEPITVNISSSAFPTQKAVNKSYQTTTEPTKAKANNIKDLFVSAETNKKVAYVNEQITYTFKFYRRIRLLSNPQLSKPDFSGFWTEEIPSKNYIANINGIQYSVTEVKTFLFPAKPGKYIIGPATLKCSVEDSSGTDPFADDFFSSFFSRGKTKVLNSNPINIDIKNLPDKNKPENFSGAIGQFNIASQIDTASAKVNEPITLSINISGSGNIKTLNEPKIPELLSFKKYETTSSMDIDNTGKTLKGSKTFKMIIVPQTLGKKTIPKIEYIYFDPNKKIYIAKNTEPISINVAQGKAGQTNSFHQLKRFDSNIKVLSKDINYIKSLNTWKNYKGPIYKTLWFPFINIAAVLLLILSVGYIKWKEKITSDVSFARKLIASGTAKKYLKKAKKYMSPNKAHDFYTALSKSLLEYIAHKANVSAEGLTQLEIEKILVLKNVSQDNIDRVKKLLEECDMIRFSPAQPSIEMINNTYNEVANLIGALEKKL